METMQVSSSRAPESRRVGTRPCLCVAESSAAGSAAQRRGHVAVTEPRAAPGLACLLPSPSRKTRASLSRAHSPLARRESPRGEVVVFASRFETHSRPGSPTLSCDRPRGSRDLSLLNAVSILITRLVVSTWLDNHAPDFPSTSLGAPLHSRGQPLQLLTPLLSVGGSQCLSRNPSSHIQRTTLYQEV